MLTSLIPPIPHLYLCEDDIIHLVLCHLLDDPIYFSFYKRMKKEGHYLILDNSAHEFRSGQPAQLLLEKAIQLGADEIVLPDVLFEGQRTVERSTEALTLFANELRDPFQDLNPRLMIVPQGHNYDEVSASLLGLVDALNTFTDHISLQGVTLGLSKDYEDFPGGLLHILEDLILPTAQKNDWEVHLLGWGRQLGALRTIALEHGGLIRSVDSAKPFVYGYYCIEANRWEEYPPYPRRPNDYFQLEFNSDQCFVSRGNVQLFQNMAGDDR